MSDPRFTHYRADGWPLCPQCDEDELYSHVCLRWAGKVENPTMADCLAGEFTCYRCNWASDSKRMVKAAEVLERLIDFVMEDVETMTPEQIEAELVAEGVDLDAMKIRLRQRLDAATTPPLPVNEGLAGGKGE